MFRTLPFRLSACALILAALAVPVSPAVAGPGDPLGGIHVSLVKNRTNCTAPNSQHGAPLSFPSCAPPQDSSNYLTVAPPNAKGRLKSRGSVRYDPIPGDPTTPASEADIAITANLIDVRCKSANAVPGFCSSANTNNAGLPDYSGELSQSSTIRIIDNYNGLSGSDEATVVDFPFPVTVTCAATSDTTIGSTCVVSTTVNAVVPGAVKEGKGTAWQVAGTQVQDGGADGTAATADNTLYQTEGFKVP